MIKIEKTILPTAEQMNFVIEGMRNPKNSWNLSDSHCKPLYNGITDDEEDYVLGEKDHELMMKLAYGGPVHAKYRRMIPICVRITAPLYWWKEFDTYKVGTVTNSCSTMHKIHDKEFTEHDFSFDHLMEIDSKDLELIKDFNPGPYYKHRFEMSWIISELNFARDLYLAADKKLKNDTLSDKEKAWLTKRRKDYWWQMIQMLPSSYNQTRNVMMNYETLHNIYTWRKNHKLDEWVEFCKWIEELPYSDVITLK